MKYLNEVKRHKAMTVYKAKSKIEIEQAFSNKKIVHFCRLKSGEWLAFFSKPKNSE